MNYLGCFSVVLLVSVALRQRDFDGEGSWWMHRGNGAVLGHSGGWEGEGADWDQIKA